MALNYRPLYSAKEGERKCARCGKAFRTIARGRKYCDEHKIQHVRERKG